MTTTPPTMPDNQKLTLVKDAIQKLPLALLQQIANKDVKPMEWESVLAELERRGLTFFEWWTKFGPVEIMRFVKVKEDLMLRWFLSSGRQGGELLASAEKLPWSNDFQTFRLLSTALECLQDWQRMLEAKTPPPAQMLQGPEIRADDWIRVPLRKMFPTKTTIAAHARDPKKAEVIRPAKNPATRGVYEIRRKHLPEYLEGKQLEEYKNL
jgi:hypothetical protein